MELFGWLFGTREVPGQAQAEFDHPKIYGEVETGPGVTAASRAAANWRDRVSTAFTDADGDLDRVLKKFDVVLQGAAAEQAKDAVTPLSQATRQSIEVASQVGAAVEQQAQGSADFKNAFPAPHQVPPDNIGWTDYVNPISYGAKSGVRAVHEEKHNQVEAHARQQYESYTQASNDRANTVQRFAPPPTFTADVEPASTTPVNKVNPSTYTGTTATASNAGSSAAQTPSGSFDTTGPTTSSGQPSASPTPQVPAESRSAWATPPAAGVTPSPIPGTSTPGPGGGGGFVGGAVIPPGSTSGPGTGVGGRTGGGTGGFGTGRGPGGGLGPRGSSGVGGSTSGSSSSGAGTRGGASGIAGGVGAAGPGKHRDEDKERTNKYLEPTDEAWKELGLPKFAPPVFGDWTAKEQEGKPPRPPEKDNP